MKILTYTCPEAPEQMRFCAIFLDTIVVKKKAHTGAPPVVHYGATEEGVTTRAQAFWEEQQAKLNKPVRRGRPPKAEAAPTPPEDDLGDVI